MISDLTKLLLEKRDQIECSAEYLKQLTSEKKAIEAKLIETMKSEDMKSVKTTTANFAITLKRDVRMIDEDALKADLTNQNLGQFLLTKVDLVSLKPVARKMMTETGEMFVGMEPVESEYLTIKINKQ